VNETAADLIAEDLACRRGERLVFTGVSFRLPPGGALVLSGANGSGKTSLLRLLAALLAPVGGRLLWGDTPIESDLAGYRTQLHYVGHQDGIKAELTPRETLSFWAALRAPGGTQAAPLLDAALAAYALEAVAEWPCRWLSAGQRRRLALARLAVTPAPIWLLDEPTSGLDHQSQLRLECAIAAHRRSGGRVVVASHTPIQVDAAAGLVLDAFAPSPEPPAPEHAAAG
jgi:heme exporter protein A